MKQALLLLLLLFIAIIVFGWGRSLYMPVVQKFKVKLSVEDVEQRLSAEVLDRLAPSLLKAGFEGFPSELYLVAFKEERLLEVYGKKNSEWQFIKAYPFTAFSGSLGPKLKEGDGQIPEGIYRVEYLNPNSSYYLSMKIDYPNAFDEAKAKTEGRTNLGSDIFIHGKAVTVGCIPVGDEAVEELFVVVTQVEGRRPQVMILPRDFRKNETYPEINSVEWSAELYDILKEELELF